MADGPNKPNRPIRPRQGAPGRKRRVVIEGGNNRPNPRQARGRTDATPKREKQEVAPPTGPATVPSGVSVRDLSQALGVPAAQIIKIMMGLGQMVQITQSLSDEEVELVGTELNREITIKHAADEEELPEVFEDAEEDLAPRPPVVTIMGHVDHGKTTLLDAIREAAVVETEAGGITQHIGAYQADVGGRKITFLDTPGHEAFTAMRARGAKVTDIAVLVVAADDSVMPQTKESISHARAADVPIVVAVNKMDMPDANPDRVKADLAAEGLQPEDWGGTVQFSNVSAKQKTNLDDLLEKVLLVADAELELTANPNAEASGPIIESRLDVGRGPVATMLVHRGTLRVGDAIVAGRRVRQGARAARLPRREGQGSTARAPPSRSSASTRRRPRASSRAWSRTSARRGRSRSGGASGSAPSSSRSARRAASRSRRSSRSWAKAPSRT